MSEGEWYKHCCDALLWMWMEGIITDGEYYKMIDKLNTWYQTVLEIPPAKRGET